MWEPRCRRPFEGEPDEVPNPADTFILTDGEPRLEWNDHFLTVWHDPNAVTFTLRQYRDAMRTVAPFTASQLDEKRHKGGLNVGYVDGHGTMTRMTDQHLSQVVIYRRQ